MANKNILTTQSKVVQVESNYFLPTAVLPSANTIPLGTTYCFLSKVEPWNDDNNPTQPTGDTYYLKQTFKNMFAAKLIQTTDISPVVPRIDWTQNTVYDYYRDDVDMTELNENGDLVYHYYVKNKYDQVFKCLWNNNGGESTYEPYFEPGSYGTNGIYQNADGYKWKFMYSIDSGLKIKFMDDMWIPVAVGANTPNPLQTTAGAGSIDVINVTDTGSGYDPANAIVRIVVSGDGTGAAATANVVNGHVVDVIVTNPGSNYSFANVSITSDSGSGATAISPTSPIGGHGFDPISELGCHHVMFTAEFNSSEGGVIPTDVDYHQVGLLTNPTARDTAPNPANSSIYRTTTDFIVAPGFGAFTKDEFVFQGSSLEDAIANQKFYARVLTFDTATNVLYLINTVGIPVNNSPVFGNSSKTARTLLSYSSSKFVPFSGYITYIENRSAIQRSDDGIEQFRFVLGY